MSAVEQQRLLVEQLRREAAIRRINVSQAVEDIKKYIAEHEKEDYLLVGFSSSQKANPFLSCAKFVQDHQQEDCLIYGFHPPNKNPIRDKNPCKVL